jgi:hypothetical protein
MLDFDLAELYEVQTKSLNLAVKRNVLRLPSDFMFQLTKKEWDSLRLQNETSTLRPVPAGNYFKPSRFVRHENLKF